MLNEGVEHILNYILRKEDKAAILWTLYSKKRRQRDKAAILFLNSY